MTASKTAMTLKRALETRDAGTLAGLYTRDATLRVIDRDHPPSMPLVLEGAPAIIAYYDDMCSREMSHVVETAIAEGDTVALTESCRYPNGARVFCAATMTLANGKIARQTTIQAWDA